MPLKLVLKSNEQVIVGEAVVRNGGSPTILCIENTVPVLREKDILPEQDAVTSCRRLYFTIRFMYLNRANMPQYQELYASLAKNIFFTYPSAAGYLDEIAECIVARDYYRALKSARKLLEHEGDVVKG